MLYFNHAGTSWPKPPEVVSAVAAALGAAPETWPAIYTSSLQAAGDFLGITDTNRLFFTTGATASLNTALSDLDWQPGERIITSRLEHHALARVLVKLSFERDIVHIRSPYRPGRPFDLDFLEVELKKGAVKLIAVSHVSNVTGEILPVTQITELAHRYGAWVLLDAAQSAGLLPLNIDALGADLVAVAGHKGPLGPQGIGLLYISPG